jgi:arylsulfatase A-like enzyme
MKRTIMLLGCLALLLCVPARGAPAGSARPNIILIYSDDVGFGDLGCYGAQQVRTPHLDILAQQSLRFTDGHCSSATCTPSRYSILTGQYAWRKKGTGILPGDANLIIDPDQPTIPSVLKSAGYRTAAIGKWHLGLGRGPVDWNTEIKPGPLEVGFDYSFIIPATPDRTPCVFVEDHRVVNLNPSDPLRVSYDDKIGDLPTGRERPDLLKMKLTHGHDGTIINGISRIGFMSGGKSAWWTDEQIGRVLAEKATHFIEQSKDKPFFLYFAVHQVHVPRVPGPDFAGSSADGTRGDSVQELDWSVGQVMDVLKRLGLSDNTLLIFSSDNGPVLDDGYDDTSKPMPGRKPGLPMMDRYGAQPAGHFRGGKYSAFEGGTRVPLLVRWPGHVKPGVSDALVSQVDFLSSFAALTGATIPAGGGPDSENHLAALLGQDQTGREVLIEQGGPLAIRKGQWKLLPGSARGPYHINAPTKAINPQLYDLFTDPGEQHNVASEHPQIVSEMLGLMKKIRGK